MLKRTNIYQLRMIEVNKKINYSFTLLIEMLESLRFFVNDPDNTKKHAIQRLENEVNKNEEDLELEIIELLSLQQPQYEEMKSLLANMKVNRDLERIGDQTMNFLKMYSISNTFPTWMAKEVDDILSQEADMLREIVAGVEAGSKEMLKQVIKQDDVIDEAHIHLFQHLVEEMKEQRLNIELGSNLIVMIRFLERLGDHIVNIAETHIDYLL